MSKDRPKARIGNSTEKTLQPREKEASLKGVATSPRRPTPVGGVRVGRQYPLRWLTPRARRANFVRREKWSQAESMQATVKHTGAHEVDDLGVASHLAKQRRWRM